VCLWRRFSVGIVAGMLGVFGLSCKPMPATLDDKAAEAEASLIASPVLTEHRFASLPDAGPGNLPPGADCKQYGARSCASTICLHTSPDPEAGWVCSQKCDCPEQCPQQWACAQIHPLESARYCLPVTQ
jgi:hypothetical protein